MKSRSEAWAYCDSSALIKRYIAETGRPAVLRLMEGRQIVSSAVLSLELQSAIGRRVREGTLATVDQPRILERISDESRRWTLISLAEAASAAEALLEHGDLRTLDAIHVASAQIFAARSGADMIFVTADARQARIAASAGLAVRSLETPAR